MAGRALPLGGPKPRLLLAALLLRANAPVPSEQLVDALWPAGTPRSAAANLRTYVHALRRELPDRIRSCSAGYLVSTEPGELDAELFEERASAARRAVRDGAQATALTLLDEAAALWRGEVLEGLAHSHAWGSTLARLTELRLSVQAERTRIRLALGDHQTAVAELRGLVAAHPLREELWQRLVLALELGGREAEALEAYREAEAILAAELDAPPGPPLRRLGERLLVGRETPAAEAGVRRVPVRQLPLDLPDFTGRDHLVGELVGLLRRHRDRRAPVVVALSGPPGVGKSATAVHVAHAVADRFPDGQLHVDLGGTSVNPRTPGNVLSELLRALGVAAGAMPRRLAERAALLRSTLAGRRICLVLDDAAGAAQVRPLLPGAGGCAVLITARVRMPDLNGAHAVDVGLLSESEAFRLLADLVGADRAAAQPASTAAIVRSCGYLPLAIRVVGARLAHRPSWPLPMMADRLRDESRRLGELRVGDLAVDASVTLSYAQLPADAALAFRGLGTLGPVQFPGWVVAALLGRPEAGDVLDTLVDAHLVEALGADEAGQPRYRLHDLLRCYAVERAAESGENGAAGLRRVIEGYLWLSAEMGGRLPVRFLGVVPEREAGLWRPADAGETRLDPVDWFAAERSTVVALVALAAQHRLDDLGWRLTGMYTPFFDLRSHQEDWLHTHAVSLDGARRSGDERGQAILLRNLGQVHIYQDDYPASLAAFGESERLFRRAGDERGTAIALSGLATALRFQGRYEHSIERACRALELFTAVGDREGEAAARIAVGTARLLQGCDGTAGRWFTDAYELCAAIGDRHREAHALKWLAMLHQRRGNLATARENVDRAIAIFGELGDDHCVGYAQQSLGELYLRGGDLPHAKLLLVNSLSAHRYSGDRRSEAEVAERLAELHATLGQPDRSREYVERARTIWAELSARPRDSPPGRPAGAPALPA